MKIKRYNHHHITISLAYSCALLMLLLFSVGFLLPREVSAATITCSSGVSSCHFTPTVKDGTARDVPDGRFLGSHARHSGYSTASKRQYLFACTKCHPSSAYTNNHQTGFKNITGTSLPGNRYSAGKKIANTNTPAFGNCSNIYCHSNGRASGMGQVQYSSARWGGTKTCLGCHGGRTSATGSPARSIGNFTLSTTHSQHLKYPAANINCNECHSKTATDAATLKNFTGVLRHANGVRDVTFASNATYGSYTSYKSTEVGSSGNTKICGNTSCHGGRTRGSWSPTSTNNDNTCVHCHGTAGTSAALANTDANRKFFAPGYKGTGTSTDQVKSSNDVRVGSHFKHISSVYMKNLLCKECHTVPTNVFDASHMGATSRYNSQTLTFAMASTAKILIGVGGSGTLSYLSAFNGYTSGTAVKAATCSSVYCHGNRLKNGAAGGTYTKPYWNYSAMVNYSNPANACARCHGNPPTSVSGSHSGKTPTTSCSGCHPLVVNSSGTIINKALHINGKVEAAGGDCLGCHASTQGTRQKVVGAGSLGVEGDDFMRPSRHVKGSGTSTAIVKNLDCVICHAEGDTTSTEASPVQSGVHGDGTINLRDVDAPASYFNWPGKRAGGATITSADRDNLDTFCMRCHDSDTSSATASRGGAYGISVNATNTALLTTGPVARRTTPFNTLDGGSALDVRGQFNYQNLVGTAWASHHNLNQFSNKRYNATYQTNNATRGGWTANTSKDGAAMNWVTGLHCSDCHLNEANAHGSRNTPRMLQTSAGTDATYTYDASSSASTLVCFRCHLNTVYALNATDGTKARLGHQDLDPKPMGTGYSADTRGVATCLNCHGGASNGGIHGSNRSVTPMGGSATKAYRFMYGSELGIGSMSDAAWASTAQPSCYTASGTWGGSCSSHNGGTSTGRIGAPRYSRPLQ